MMTEFYCRTWVRSDKIYTLHTDSNPIEFNSFDGWCHAILDFIVEGEYTMAGDMIGKLSYVDGLIVSDDFIIKDVSTVDYVVPSEEEIKKEESYQVRQQRDNILKNVVDPISSNALRWAALTADQQSAWANYRQSLLDLTAQDGFPMNVVWPDPPQ